MVDYPRYREQGIVGEGDSYVVAINACRIPFAVAEDNPPRILKAVLPIGCQQITVDLATGESKADTFVPRNLIGKNQGEGVNTDLFLSEDHRALSAVLYSRANALNGPQTLGQDFILVHNPRATAPLQLGLIPVGVEMTIDILESGFKIGWKNYTILNRGA